MVQRVADQKGPFDRITSAPCVYMLALLQSDEKQYFCFFSNHDNGALEKNLRKRELELYSTYKKKTALRQ